MANNVFANGREVSCKKADGKSICCFPDVCMTPPQTPATPPGIPIPYPNTAFAKDTSSGSKHVKISAKEVMLKNKSFFKTSIGDEAGCAPKKGIMTGKIKGKAYFTSWSMNVKIEGRNVDRHMDLTTHNHGSNANTGPWLYGDQSAWSDGGVCDKPPEKMATKIRENCTAARGKTYADDRSPACCEARRCMMVPFSPNKCCEKNGKPMTPHHPIPHQDHYTVGSRKKPINERKLLPGAGGYNGDKAPCVCVEGPKHNSVDGNNELMEHGRIGRAFAHYRDYEMKDGDGKLTKEYTYHQAKGMAAQIVAQNTGCDAECIEAQMDDYHVKKVNATGTLRKSRQTRKGGEEHYNVSPNSNPDPLDI